MNKLQQEKFKASKFFLIKKFKKLKIIYLAMKNNEEYIKGFNDDIAKCKTKEEAQNYIDKEFEAITKDVK